LLHRFDLVLDQLEFAGAVRDEHQVDAERHMVRQHLHSLLHFFQRFGDVAHE